MAINTLITIKDSLQLFVDQHQQLQRVVFGADDARAQLITESELFPMIYVAPVDVLVGEAHNTHRLRVYVYEKLNEDVSDFWENANDTSLMLRDIRVWWNAYNMDSDILISENPTGQIKTDAELDGLVGYSAEILFQIPSHGRCDVPLAPVVQPPLPTCAPVTYTITRDNQPFDSGSIASGGDLVVNVPSLCAPATFNLNGVEVGTAASGGELNILVKNTANTQVGSLISGEFIVPDATANIQLLGVTQQTVSIPSGASSNIQALPNVPEFGPRKSGQTLISLPNDATNNLLGMGQDWWNLRPTPNNINCFGNYKRFTNVIGNYQDEISGTYFDSDGVALGTQTFAAAFPSGIVIDWFSRFPLADGTRMFVYGWALESISTTPLNRLDAANYCNGLTVGGFAVWKLPKKVNIDLLANESMTVLSNYRPLNSSSANFSLNFWLEDSTPSGNIASRYSLGSAAAPYTRNRDPLETNRVLPIRVFEIVQTGSGFVLI